MVCRTLHVVLIDSVLLLMPYLFMGFFCVTGLVEWASWVRCYSEDTQAGALAASLESVTTVAVAALPDQDWCKTRAAVVALFARKADARQGGSQLLRDVIYAGSGLHVSSTEPHTSR